MNPDDLKKLKVTGSCAMGDLQDADLRGIDLREMPTSVALTCAMPT